MTDRQALGAQFVASAGWQDAQRRFLAGDASDRSYDRLTRGTETAVLMDAPPGKGDDPATFLKIAAHLSALGLSAPRCLAQDLHNGFLLLEDLGDDIYARQIDQNPALELPLYRAAVDVLVYLHQTPPMPQLPNLQAQDWAEAACFALDWYRFAITGDRVDSSELRACLTDLIRTHADGPRVMILRDFHAENLLWMPQRNGLARVGLLDFQLAQLGQPGYDLVSMLQDARRDVSRETEATILRYFVDKTATEEATFKDAYAVMGAQRALRILGVFARLCLVTAKASYVALMPRVWEQLHRNLTLPALAPLAKICANLLPPATPEALAKIGSNCGHFR